MLSPDERREACRRGGLARAAQFTTESQRAAREKVQPESLRASGRKGWMATASKYGADVAAKQLAAWRREHPTKPEQIVIEWLDGWGIAYQREDPFTASNGTFYVDFRLADGRAIEVDGAIWHRNDPLHGEDREGRDRAKNAAFTEAAITVLRLTEADVNKGTARGTLEAWLGQE